MRLFIGLKLDSSTVAAVDRALQPFRKMPTPIHWVKPENMHLTIKFIGETEETTASAVKETLADLDHRTAPFDLTIRGFGTFGRDNDVRVFWAGIAENAALAELARTIEHGLEKIGIPPETRPFTPHLTLGRNKTHHNFRPLLLKIRETDPAVIASETIRGFQLFKSDLAPQGPTYTVIKEVPFQNA